MQPVCPVKHGDLRCDLQVCEAAAGAQRSAAAAAKTGVGPGDPAPEAAGAGGVPALQPREAPWSALVLRITTPVLSCYRMLPSNLHPLDGGWHQKVPIALEPTTAPHTYSSAENCYISRHSGRIRLQGVNVFRHVSNRGPLLLGLRSEKSEHYFFVLAPRSVSAAAGRSQ